MRRASSLVRGLPGALVLGLLAAIVAHAVLFAGGHAMGGAYHAALIEVASSGALGLLAFLAGLAFFSRGRAADGSILAARLSGWLPNLPALVVTTGVWFAIGERLETAHASPPLLVAALVLALAAWLLHRFARVVLGTIADAVFSVTRISFAPRIPSWVRRAAPAPRLRRARIARRRFARPPPIATTGARL